MTTHIRSSAATPWRALQCTLGESLIWDDRSHRFWWVDVPAGVLYRGEEILRGFDMEVRRHLHAELEARGLRQAVLDAARSKPFLGICIGLQMLFEHSDEGDVDGPRPRERRTVSTAVLT